MAFSEHIKNFAHSHAAKTAHEWINQNRSDHNALHGNMPGASDYIKSDAGRATARHAVGTGINEFLTRGAKKSFRKGSYVTGALMTFAHMAFASHMAALKNDQRIFENVAKVRRGDPEVQHMSHQHLREVAAQAQKYGGHDSEHIHKAAQGEIDRRMTQKNTEHAKGMEHRDNLVNANKEALRERSHIERMRRLKEAAGHTAATRLDMERKVNKIQQQREQIKTKGVQSRQTSIRATVRAREKLIITERTKSGGGYDSKGNFHTKDEIAKNSAAVGHGSTPKHGPAQGAAPRRRKRAI